MPRVNIVNRTERQEQTIVISWIKLQHSWLIDYTLYIMNERKCSIQTGKRLNDMGRLAGASDLFIAWPTNHYYGLWIEMKRKGGIATKVQKDFLARMNKIGYLGKIAHGADEAIKIIKEYLG